MADILNSGNLFEDKGQLLSSLGARHQATPNSRLVYTSYQLGGGSTPFTSNSMFATSYLEDLNVARDGKLTAEAIISDPSTAIGKLKAGIQAVIGQDPSATTFRLAYPSDPSKASPLFHPKAAVYSENGVLTEGFVGTANITSTGHGVGRMGLSMGNQFNVAYRIRDKGILGELSAKLEMLKKGVIPDSSPHILVGGPTSRTPLGQQVADLIRNTRGTMVVTSATLSPKETHIVAAIRDKLARGERVEMYVGGVSASDVASGKELVAMLKRQVPNAKLNVHMLKAGQKSHANLYAFPDTGRLIVGSARLSNSAMTGDNVELMLNTVDRTTVKGLEPLLQKVFEGKASHSWDYLTASGTLLKPDKLYGSSLIMESLVSIRGTNETLYKFSSHVPASVRREIRRRVAEDLTRRGGSLKDLPKAYNKAIQQYSTRGSFTSIYTESYKLTRGKFGMDGMPVGPAEIPTAIRIADFKAYQMTLGEQWNITARHDIVEGAFGLGAVTGFSAGAFLGRNVKGGIMGAVIGAVVGSVAATKATKGLNLSDFTQMDGRGYIPSLALHLVRRFELSQYERQREFAMTHGVDFNRNYPGFDKGPIQQAMEVGFDFANAMLMLGATYAIGLRFTARLAADMHVHLMDSLSFTSGARRVGEGRVVTSISSARERGVSGPTRVLQRHTRRGGPLIRAVRAGTQGVASLAHGVAYGVAAAAGEAVQAVTPLKRVNNKMMRRVRRAINKGESHSRVVREMASVATRAAEIIADAPDKTGYERVVSWMNKALGPVIPAEDIRAATRRGKSLKARVFGLQHDYGTAKTTGAFVYGLLAVLAVYNNINAAIDNADPLTVGEQREAYTQIRNLYGDDYRVPQHLYRAGYNQNGYWGIGKAAFLWDNWIAVPTLNEYNNGTYDYLNETRYKIPAAAIGIGVGSGLTSVLSNNINKHMGSRAKIPVRGAGLFGALLGGAIGWNLNYILSKVARTGWTQTHLEGSERQWVTLGTQFNEAAALLRAAEESKERYFKSGNPEDKRIWYELLQKAVSYRYLKGDGTAGDMKGYFNQIGYPLLGMMTIGFVDKVDAQGKETRVYSMGFQAPFHIQLGLSMTAPFAKVSGYDHLGRPEDHWEHVEGTAAEGMISLAYLTSIPTMIGVGKKILGRANGRFVGTTTWLSSINMATNPFTFSAKIVGGGLTLAKHIYEGTVNAGKPVGTPTNVPGVGKKSIRPKYNPKAPGPFASFVLASELFTAIGIGLLGTWGYSLSDENIAADGKFRSINSAATSLETEGGALATLLATGVAGTVGAVTGYRATLYSAPEATRAKHRGRAAKSGLIRGAGFAALMMLAGAYVDSKGSGIWIAQVFRTLAMSGVKQYKIDSGVQDYIDYNKAVNSGLVGTWDMTKDRMAARKNIEISGRAFWWNNLTHLAELPNAMYTGIANIFFGMGAAAGAVAGTAEDAAFRWAASFTQMQTSGQDWTVSHNTWGKGGKMSNADVVQWVDNISKSAEFLSWHRQPYKSRISGVMFYSGPGSALHGSPASVRMVVAQRMAMHSWAMAAWPDEFANTLGLRHTSMKMYGGYYKRANDGSMRNFETGLGALDRAIFANFKNLQGYIQRSGTYQELDGLGEAEYESRREEAAQILYNYRKKLSDVHSAGFNAGNMDPESSAAYGVGYYATLALAGTSTMWATKGWLMSKFTGRPHLVAQITHKASGAAIEGLDWVRDIRNRRMGTAASAVRPLAQDTSVRFLSDPTGELIQRAHQHNDSLLHMSNEAYYLDANVHMNWVVTGDGKHRFGIRGMSITDAALARINTQIGRFNTVTLTGRTAAEIGRAINADTSIRYVMDNFVTNIHTAAQQLMDARAELHQLMSAEPIDSGFKVHDKFESLVDRMTQINDRVVELENRLSTDIMTTDDIKQIKSLSRDVERLMVEASDRFGMVKYGLDLVDPVTGKKMGYAGDAQVVYETYHGSARGMGPLKPREARKLLRSEHFGQAKKQRAEAERQAREAAREKVDQAKAKAAVQHEFLSTEMDPVTAQEKSVYRAMYSLIEDPEAGKSTKRPSRLSKVVKGAYSKVTVPFLDYMSGKLMSGYMNMAMTGSLVSMYATYNPAATHEMKEMAAFGVLSNFAFMLPFMALQERQMYNAAAMKVEAGIAKSIEAAMGLEDSLMYKMKGSTMKGLSWVHKHTFNAMATSIANSPKPFWKSVTALGNAVVSGAAALRESQAAEFGRMVAGTPRAIEAFLAKREGEAIGMATARFASRNVLRAGAGAALGYAVGGGTGAAFGAGGGLALLRGGGWIGMALTFGAFMLADYAFRDSWLSKKMTAVQDWSHKGIENRGFFAGVLEGALLGANIGLVAGSAFAGIGAVPGAIGGLVIGGLVGGITSMTGHFAKATKGIERNMHIAAVGIREYLERWKWDLYAAKTTKPKSELVGSVHSTVSAGMYGIASLANDLVFGAYSGMINDKIRKEDHRGTSVSLRNNLIRQFSPIWHGNLTDFVEESLKEQEKMRLGAPGNSIYTMLHPYLFNEYKSGIGYEFIQHSDIPARFAGVPNGLGMASVAERRVGTDFLPDDTSSPAVMQAVRMRSMMTDTWGLGQSLKHKRENQNTKKDTGHKPPGEASVWGGVTGAVSKLLHILGIVTPSEAAVMSGNGSYTGGGSGGTYGAAPSDLSIDSGAGIVRGGVVKSQFGMRHHPILHRYINHDGIDISGPVGSSARVAADGRVEKVGSIGGYGNVVTVRHSNGYSSMYAHLASQIVKPGDVVVKGQVVGTQGHTGWATGDHVHYEVRDPAGRPVNPNSVRWGTGVSRTTPSGVAAPTNNGNSARRPLAGPTTTQTISTDTANRRTGGTAPSQTQQAEKAMSSAGGWNQTVLKNVNSMAGKNAGYYLNLLENAASKHGIDKNLVAMIAAQESGFNRGSTSYSGAIGIMQVMPFHFKSAGLMNRAYEPEVNIDLGVKLAAGYQREVPSRVTSPSDRIKFGLANYNAGPGNVRDAMAAARAHGLDDRRFENVVQFLPCKEHREYAYKVLAWAKNYQPRAVAAGSNNAEMRTGKYAGAGGSMSVEFGTAVREASIDVAQEKTNDSRVPSLRYAVIQGGVAYTAKGEVVDNTEVMSANAADVAPYVDLHKRTQDTVFAHIG